MKKLVTPLKRILMEEVYWFEEHFLEWGCLFLHFLLQRWIMKNTELIRSEIFRSLGSVAGRCKEISRVNSAVIRPRPGPRSRRQLFRLQKTSTEMTIINPWFGSGLQQSQVWTSIRKNPRSVEKPRRTVWRNLCPWNWFRNKKKKSSHRPLINVSGSPKLKIWSI